MIDARTPESLVLAPEVVLTMLWPIMPHPPIPEKKPEAIFPAP